MDKNTLKLKKCEIEAQQLYQYIVNQTSINGSYKKQELLKLIEKENIITQGILKGLLDQDKNLCYNKDKKGFSFKEKEKVWYIF